MTLTAKKYVIVPPKRNTKGNREPSKFDGTPSEYYHVIIVHEDNSFSLIDAIGREKTLFEVIRTTRSIVGERNKIEVDPEFYKNRQAE
jgi:hypothetical protein